MSARPEAQDERLILLGVRDVSKRYQRSSPSTASRCRSTPASPWRCSAPTAPASRHRPDTHPRDRPRSRRGPDRRAGAACGLRPRGAPARHRLRALSGAHRCDRPVRRGERPRRRLGAARGVRPITAQPRARRSRVPADRAGGRAGTLVARLSPAERRLVMIARALVAEPKTMILDEPTAAGSADREADRIVTVLTHLRATGMSIVYISHRMGEITRICDTVLVLRDGRVVMEAAASRRSVSEAVVVGFAAPRAVGRPDAGVEPPPAPGSAAQQPTRSAVPACATARSLEHRSRCGVARSWDSPACSGRAGPRFCEPQRASTRSATARSRSWPAAALGLPTTRSRPAWRCRRIAAARAAC